MLQTSGRAYPPAAAAPQPQRGSAAVQQYSVSATIIDKRGLGIDIESCSITSIVILSDMRLVPAGHSSPTASATTRQAYATAA